MLKLHRARVFLRQPRWCVSDTRAPPHGVSPAGTRRFCSVAARRMCWSCGSAAELFFCPACKVIQPPEDSTSYFHLLKCDRTFTLDTQKLQRRFLELQKFLHPDNFSQKSAKEQEYSEQQSALVNKAYRTLQKPLTRAVYMLELEGVELEAGTDASADPAFLLRIMEINEQLAETRGRDKVQAIGQRVRDELKNLTEQMSCSLTQGDLLRARDLLAQMKYLTNIQEKVKERITDQDT